MRTLFLFFCLLLLPAMLAAATIEGRVVIDDEPLAGVTVAAYPQLDYSAEPVGAVATSDAEGYYRLQLPQGTYALFGWDAERTRFAFCGRNPVNLAAETVWAGLQAVPVAEVKTGPYGDEYSAAIEGQVLFEGEPLADAYVSLYLDADEDLKGRGYRLSMPTADDGYFRFDGLPESDYFLVARKRAGGQRVGPVQAGDLFGIFPGNPLTALSGQLAEVTLHSVAKQKESFASETFGRATGPVLRGRIVDDSGEPVADVHVFAYVDRVIGHQRPAAISPPTGVDGRFIVNLPAPGTYYVGAREAYGDSPAPGELFGMYEKSADHGLTLDEGQSLDDLEITVEPVEIF